MNQPDDFRRLVGFAHAVARELSSRKVAGDTYRVRPASSTTVDVGFLFRKKETRTTPEQRAAIGGWRVFSQFEKEEESRTPISKYAVLFERREYTREVWLRFDGTLEIVEVVTHVAMNTSPTAGWTRHDPDVVSRARLSPRDAYRLDQRSEIRGGRTGNWRYYHAPAARTTNTLRAALEVLRSTAGNPT